MMYKDLEAVTEINSVEMMTVTGGQAADNSAASIIACPASDTTYCHLLASLSTTGNARQFAGDVQALH